MTNIDLTEIAQRMGVEHVPPVVERSHWLAIDLAWMEIHSNFRGDADPTKSKMYFDTLTLTMRDRHPNIMSSLQQRIIRTVGRELHGLDFLRWVAAHELTHQWQAEHYTDYRKRYAEDAVPGPHEGKPPMEREADDYAGRLWRYVKINGRMARGAKA